MLKRLLDGCFKRRGFSLIELSVVLVVSSLMLGFGLQAVQSTGAVDCTAITRQQMITIHAAVDKYVKAHGFYPRPAARGVAITDPQFGRQVAAGSYTRYLCHGRQQYFIWRAALSNTGLACQLRGGLLGQ